MNFSFNTTATFYRSNASKGLANKMEEVNEVRHQLDNDDPDLVELKIGPGQYAPHDGDWGRLGVATGRNTHLRELDCFSFDGRPLTKTLKSYSVGLPVIYPFRSYVSIIAAFLEERYSTS